MAAVVEPVRSVRVFVSSTFRDMQAEREELVKRVFPQIRRLCEQRGVAGARSICGGASPTSRRPRARCCRSASPRSTAARPYFIGLLGQRYGWVPDETPRGRSVAAARRGSASCPGPSVTEMEMLHGVLNDPEAAGHAVLLPARPGVDGSHARRRSRRCWASAERRGDRRARRRRLRGSAARASCSRSSSTGARLGPPSPTTAIRSARRAGARRPHRLVERLFPAGEPPDPLASEAAAHHAFGAARRGGHIERPGLDRALDAHVGGDGPPLLVTGEPGADLTRARGRTGPSARRRRPSRRRRRGPPRRRHTETRPTGSARRAGSSASCSPAVDAARIDPATSSRTTARSAERCSSSAIDAPVRPAGARCSSSTASICSTTSTVRRT